jgi:hypothetical protein
MAHHLIAHHFPQIFTGGHGIIGPPGGSGKMSAFDLLTPQDRRLFEEATGQTLSDDFLPHLNDSRKLLELPELNARGLQVARYLYYNRAFDRSLPDGPMTDFYREHGYIEVPDFLSPWERRIMRIFGRASLKKKLGPFHHFLAYTELRKRALLPRTIVHEPGDHQYNFHLDVIYPAVKFWYSEQGVPAEKGPVQVSPGSCFPSLPLLQFIYAVSTAQGDELGKYDRRARNVGSPRLACDAPDQIGEVKRAGFAPPINLIEKPNTLYIMDCRLIHRRGEAPAGTVRLWHHVPFRRTMPAMRQSAPALPGR